MRRIIHGGFVVALFSAVLSVTAAPVGAQTVTCGGLAATIVGTEGNDRIVGTPGDDVVLALGGDDLVIGGDGNDVICLGEGNDRALGQKGEDFILGEGGNDIMTGGNRGDFIDGGLGNDTIRGNNGIDTLIGGPGDDVVLGGRNNDFIEGNDGDDELRGGAALDEILGGPGNDDIFAGRGRDVISGEAGLDFLDGGLGDDRIFAIDDQPDVIADRDGTDTCIFDPFDSGLSCELGDITSERGDGDAEVDFDPDRVAPFALSSSFAGGPYFVLQYAATATNQQVEIAVIGDTGAVIDVLVIPAGINFSSGNVLIQGTPAGAIITGADEWHVGVVSPDVFFDATYDNVLANKSVVYGLANAVDGTDSQISFFNPHPVDSFALVAVLGPGGIVFNEPFAVPAGTTEVASSTLFDGDQIIGVYAPGLDWEYIELN